MLMHKKEKTNKPQNNPTCVFTEQVGYRVILAARMLLTDVCSSRKVINHAYSQFCAQQSLYVTAFNQQSPAYRL